MQAKVSLRWSLVAIAAVAILCAATVSLFLSAGATAQDSGKNLAQTTSIPVPAAPADSESANFGVPVRIEIPKIKVNAVLESVGLEPGGGVDVPKVFANAAWFNLGPRPGARGSAIIDGHFGWKRGVPAVFNDLSKLQKGDKVYVEDENGVTMSFVVREFRTYSENEAPPAVFISGDGEAHLNLITCGGVWDKAQKSYPDRLVVFTDRVYEQKDF